MAKQTSLSLQPPAQAVQQTWTPDDIYERAEINPEDVITKCSEDHRVERKPARFEPRQLGDYFSIFANRAPHGGVIFVGVSDDGVLEGCCRLDPKRLNELEQSGQTYCPEARYDYKRIPFYTKSGAVDFILAFRIAYRPEKLVETTKGEAYTRVGSSKKKLSELEKREIRINKREIGFESEDVGLKWPDDFDLELVQAYASSFVARRGLSGTPSVPEVFQLSHLGRIAPDGFIPNVACTLLFAKDPRTLFPGCRIRLFKFAGTTELTGTKRNEVADVWIDGLIPQLIAKAERAIADHLDGPSQLDDTGRFSKASIYPKDAWPRLGFGGNRRTGALRPDQM